MRYTEIMQDVTSANFGLVIAFLLPGFVALWGIGEFSATIHAWFTGAPAQSPTVGGFLYVTLGAVAAGLFVSTIRWLIIDSIHHRTGIQEPKWDFAVLNQQLPTFELLVASHYRFYQAYSNLAVAALLLFGSLWVSGELRGHPVESLVGLCIIEAILWQGSRDTLKKYYRRAEALMSTGRVGDAERDNTNPKPVMSEPAKRRSARLKIEGPFR